MSYFKNYVNHMLRFFARYHDQKNNFKFKKNIDYKNWCIVQSVLNSLPEKDRNVIIEVYRRGDTIPDNIYHVSKEIGIKQDTVWSNLKKVTKRIAEERELI